MKSENQLTRLKNYKPPTHQVKSIDLTFKLNSERTIVNAKIHFIRNKKNSDLVLDGKELKLLSVKIDNQNIDLNSLKLTSKTLEVPNKLINTASFIWEAETEISPIKNTELEGLYFSSEMFCTQCEAEGFRKITYFLDRPDIMTLYSVRIESELPVLLSNGNMIKSGPGFAEWTDPWPKPSYLFALVAGNLANYEDFFTTKSGRVVTLKIFVKPENVKKCIFAMSALKRAMKWEEDTYQREYDLDLFMIVAVEDFNMGAMENKGLNIFNSKFILADSETATDKDYDFIERIVAHEYFHNWTGNRVTCRDWFQLCLKEGLTVFREQQFIETFHDKDVKRIQDVINLRHRQFREDDGPLCHAVRPDEYLEINNFYTATVYEKGAEIVRMLLTIVGNRNFKKSVDAFLTTYDGKACTVENWLEIFEKTLDIDLDQFSLWYTQKGRPKIMFSEAFKNGVYELTFSQELNSLPEVPVKPMVIPIKIGLLDDNGNEIQKSETIILSKREDTFRFSKFKTKPIPSVFRDFSAPVSVQMNIAEDRLLTLATHDTNLVNRWFFMKRLLLDGIENFIIKKIGPCKNLINSLADQLSDRNLKPSFRALLVSTPGHGSIAEHLSQKNLFVDPTKIYLAIQTFKEAIAQKVSLRLFKLYDENKIFEEYAPTSQQAGHRDMRLRVLDLIHFIDPETEEAKKLFFSANNMTDKLGALAILLRHNKVKNEVEVFYNSWKKNNLVIDKWFSVQATNVTPLKSVPTLMKLTRHEAFSFKNPNRFRSVIGAFASGNFCGFHESSGQGYDIVTDWILKMDPINPQTAASICTVFDNWKIFDLSRQNKIKNNLERLLHNTSVSKNTFEIVQKILED